MTPSFPRGGVSGKPGVVQFDTVDTSISASISVGHTWTNSTTDSYTIGHDIPSHSVGWLGSIRVRLCCSDYAAARGMTLLA